MRWVDPERVEDVLTPDWLDSARAAKTKIEQAEDEAVIRAVLTQCAEVWREAKDLIKPVMNGKCWYCETPNPRSDNAVDHFRPKSRYWWLAFDYENMRFSCTYCNSRRVDRSGGTAGGKQDKFPIAGVLAKGPDESIDDELPVLLDPCKYEEPRLLWFDETGRPTVNPAVDDPETTQDRVAESILLYHLDYGPLTRLRRRKYLDVISACRTGDLLRDAYRASGEPALKKQWWERVAQVRRLIDQASPHSAAARCAALGLKASSATAQEALEVM